MNLTVFPEKTIINFCPTGMVPTKEMTPHVSLSVTEIVEDVHAAHELGITIAHLHARDLDGTPSWKPEIYRDIMEGIRRYCPDLVICLSSSGRNFAEFEKRSAAIELRPDMCSMTLSSLNFQQQASINPPEMIKSLAKKMSSYGVHPELECFDLGMINYGLFLMKKGILSGPFYWNLLFGNIAGMQADLLTMGTILAKIPEEHCVAVAGLGSNQLKSITTAIAHNLGIRIGLEDNIWYDKGRTRLATNLELLERVHKILEIYEGDYLKPKQFGEHGFYNTQRG